jgi:hypothetical protein
VNVSVPAMASALALHVSVPLELLQAGFAGVRFVAVDAGEPVYGEPLTVANVMMTDCVFGETYFGVRRASEAVVVAGTVMVNRALVAGFALAAGCATGAAPEPPPPPHAESAIRSAIGASRLIIIVPVRSAC